MGRVFMARPMPPESLECAMWGPSAAAAAAAAAKQSPEKIKAERDRYKEALLEITRSPFGWQKHDIAVRALEDDK